MQNSRFCRIDQPTVIGLAGEDRLKFLQSFTTQDMALLERSDSIETFITDVKGRIVSHGFVFHSADGSELLYISFPKISAEQPDAQNIGISHYEQVVNHLDRYVIREDVAFTDRSLDFEWYAELLSTEGEPMDANRDLQYGFGWGLTGENLRVIALTPEVVDEASPTAHSGADGRPSPFELARIRAGWPRFGIDFDTKNLPQEVARETQTISFTKGCYLGQETVARLDALGQTQKELAVLHINSAADASLDLDQLQAAELFAGTEKVNGLIKSVAVASGESTAIAIAMIRRPYFTKDTQLSVGSLDSSITAIVQ
jgi:folate-binding protein YgfZ